MVKPTSVGVAPVGQDADGAAFWIRRWETSAAGLSTLPRFESVAIGSIGPYAGSTLVLEAGGAGFSVLRCAADVADRFRLPDVQREATDQWLALLALARRSIEAAVPCRERLSWVVDGRVEVRELVALPMSSCWGTRYVLVYMSGACTSYGIVEHVYRSTREGFITLAPARNQRGEVVDLKIVSVNWGATQIVGRSEAQLLAQPASLFGNTTKGDSVLSVLLRCFVSDGSESVHFEFALDDAGTTRHLSCSASSRDGLVFKSIVDVTEIEARERSFHLLFESNPVPMWLVDAETTRFLDVNAAALRHYGYARAHFLGLSQFDLLHPDEHGPLRSVEADPAGSYDGERTWRHRRADGSEILVVPYARRLVLNGRPAALAAFIDVTATREAEAELRRTQSFLDTIVENIPSALLVRDAVDQRLLLINKAGEQLFDMDRATAIGRRLQDDPSNRRARGVLDPGGPARVEGRSAPVVEEQVYADADGTSRTLLVKKLTIPDGEGHPRYLLGLAEDVTERREIEGRIAYLAHHDALTGLPNRTFFSRCLAEALVQSQRGGCPPAVHALDLDSFKIVNDTLGHSAGDDLLAQVARRLQSCLQADDVVARFGGDEFVILQAGPVGNGPAGSLAEMIVSVVAQPFTVMGQEVRIGTSIGIALAPVDGTDAETLLRNADLALYRAKAEGKSGFRFFEAEMNDRLQGRRNLELELRSALEDGRLELHYQPLVDIASERTCCCEALLRWRHPERGFVSPAEFIPLAEETGLIGPIGDWVLREACMEARHWPSDIRVAVNVSPVQFRNGRLVSLVVSALASSGLAPDRLEIEITESVLLANTDANFTILRRLREIGIRIAMDDFGTGYSSLGYLSTFPFDKIKIDRSFVRDLGASRRCDAIVGAIADLGRHLGIVTVAEGVETEDQLARLRTERCSQAQGFLFSRPVPARELHAMLARQSTVSDAA